MTSGLLNNNVKKKTCIPFHKPKVFLFVKILILKHNFSEAVLTPLYFSKMKMNLQQLHHKNHGCSHGVYCSKNPFSQSQIRHCEQKQFVFINSISCVYYRICLRNHFQTSAPHLSVNGGSILDTPKLS